jgi:hypothetical protein
MRKFRFALLSVVFIALAMGVCALQAGAALYQWLTGRTRRTFRIGLPGASEGGVPDHPGRASGKKKPRDKPG